MANRDLAADGRDRARLAAAGTSACGERRAVVSGGCGAARAQWSLLVGLPDHVAARSARLCAALLRALSGDRTNLVSTLLLSARRHRLSPLRSVTIRRQGLD